MGKSIDQNSARKRHLLKSAKNRAEVTEAEAVREILAERLAALEALDRRLIEADTDELRDLFQQLLLMVRDCVEVFGRGASATASIKVDSDGEMERIDVGIGTEDHPNYVGDYDLVVVINQNPYVSYEEIKEEVRKEIALQEENLEDLLQEFDS